MIEKNKVKLSALVNAAGMEIESDALISSIVLDSRQAKEGSLFVALQGGSVDGHDFIRNAEANGGAAVIGTRADVKCSVPYFRVEDARKALAQVSAAFYGNPAHRLIMIGVTGTDGKTTTSNFLYHILKQAGIAVGMISTVNAVIGEKVLDTGFHVTTPEAMDVQRYLRMMVDAGITHAVLETTSHGLAQQRVGNCAFDIGVVTNITHEHLDYHGSYKAYRAAKSILFEGLGEVQKENGVEPAAVLNLDDQSYDYLPGLAQGKQFTYSIQKDAHFHANKIRHNPAGLDFEIWHNSQSYSACINLAGEFNVSNALAAFGAAVGGLGIDPQEAAEGLAALTGVPGRMELINLGQDFTAIVDFAHTPNALKNTLSSGRKMTAGRVIAVFGSAGLRDKAKRRMMAEVSAEYADITILTAEDPRTESLDGILQEMAEGAETKGAVEGETFYRVRDRGEAIRLGLKLAKPGDIVMACGKGHEQSMCFGAIEHSWDDRTAMRAALAEYLGVDGPAMPWLPTREG